MSTSLWAGVCATYWEKFVLIVSKIEDEIRNQYVLVYSPPDDVKSGKRHKLEIKVTRPGLIVRSRTTYYR